MEFHSSNAQAAQDTGRASLYRSLPMDFLRMVFPKQAAHRAVRKFGHLAKVQFIDLNAETPATQREYSPQLQRCAEMERLLRAIRDRCEEHGVPTELPTEPEPDGEPGGDAADDPSNVLDGLEPEVRSKERFLEQLTANMEELLRNKWQCTEHKYALEQAQQLTQDYGGGAAAAAAGGLGVPLLARGELQGGATDGSSAGSELTQVIGVLAASGTGSFQRILHRATHGNILVKFCLIPELIWDAQQREEIRKVVFVAFLQGGAIVQKVHRICSVLGARVFDFSGATARDKLGRLDEALKEHERVLASSRTELHRLLTEVAAAWGSWQAAAAQETAIFSTLNRFKYTGGGQTGEYVVAEGWVPKSAMGEVRRTLDAACAECGVGQQGNTIDVSEAPRGASVPPTHYVVNKYSSAFQAIVEAYGVARYREHNPTPYTIVTFPFLFAVMFGDAGHGLLMLAAAVYFIVKEEELGKGPINEMVQTPFDGRYVMLLMSIFSMYCGLIYNEVFGMPLNVLGTRWHFGANATMAGGWKECYDSKTPPVDGPVSVYNDTSMQSGCNLPPLSPYPFGMDPIWKNSSGGLIFFNSLKMKMSVVFGVVQMVFGIILKATNDIKHRRRLDLWCEFVPQMIFMNGIFGYMVMLIIVKWNTCWVPVSHFLPGGELDRNPDGHPDDWDKPSTNHFYTRSRPFCEPVEGVNVLSDPATNSWKGYSAPPDVKQILINMFMHPTDNFPEQFNLFEDMHQFHLVLVPVVMLMPLIMLLPKPFVLKARNTAGTLEHDPADPHAGEEFDFSEVFIHQVIETIEFVLGAVSNTASYLRLWALSLAHSQLTDVFFEKVLGMCLEMVKEEGKLSPALAALTMFVGFAVWISVTFGVLMVMESLSAVLHALRLHWVEFQNKFYKGDGVKFVPFSFEVEETEA